MEAVAVAIRSDVAVAPRPVFTSLVAAVALAVAQLADLMTFLGMIAVGGLGAEANPLVSHVGEVHGVAVLVVLKLTMTGFTAVTFALLSRMSTPLAGIVLTVGTLSGIIGAVSNVLALS